MQLMFAIFNSSLPLRIYNYYCVQRDSIRQILFAGIAILAKIESTRNIIKQTKIREKFKQSTM